MKRGFLLALSIGAILLTIVLGVQFYQNGAYHDGRCGSHRWLFRVLWFNLDQPDYDEYGIEEQWVRAHRIPCEHIWIRGLLESDDGAYWPPLHLAIAEGIPLNRIWNMVDNMSDTDLKKKDALGRTILHWLVGHPDIEHRQELVELLMKRGVSLDEKDSDGLSPRDWAVNSQKAPAN
jgi:hypothetical protein